MNFRSVLFSSLVLAGCVGSIPGEMPVAPGGTSGSGTDSEGMTPPPPGSTTLPPSLRSCESTLPLGKGSFATQLPAGAAAPQTKVYKTARLTGAMPTNRWWSSLAWVPFSETLFPHPLAIKATESGLAVDAPRPSSSANGITAGFSTAFTIGSTATAKYKETLVDGFSDWTVSMLWADGDNSLRITAGHGLPFVYAEYKGGGAKLHFEAAPQVFAGDAGSSILGVKVGERAYGLFAPSGARWTGLGSPDLVSTLEGKGYLSVAALPDASAETLAAFGKYAYAFVTDARADFSYDEASGKVRTTYKVTTVAKEGTERGTVQALYPHQWKNSDASFLAYTYPSVRGVMKTVAGESFNTTMTFHGNLPMLPAAPGNLDAGAYGKLVSSSLEPTMPPGADTYWMGKELGRLATLAPIADLAGNADTAKQARTRIAQTLESYLSATPGKKDHLFYYEPTWGTLIGYPASYGSDDHLNDHHFHYGYWIRAAAELARVDAAWAKMESWGTMVQLVVQDIANWDRENPCFPYLRNFDPYAGHSWASGDGKFADGNNNESSSEGMNAWASLVLWGEATGNKTVRDVGVYLYTTEAAAIEQYWFDVDGDNMMTGFSHNYASMIWGAKTVYETWFSPDPQMIRGINMLPLTSTSLYLGYRPATVKANMAQLAQEHGSSNWTVWSDVLWGYQAFDNPGAAIALHDAAPSYAPEAGESRAHTHSMLHALAQLGQVSTKVTADTALYGVFDKGGVVTHLAYNAGSAPRVVHFSDGKQLTVAPGKLAVE